MQSKFEVDPVIGHLKKALDENGKFHVSCLKPLIKQTVAKIAGSRNRTTLIFRSAPL